MRFETKVHPRLAFGGKPPAAPAGAERGVTVFDESEQQKAFGLSPIKDFATFAATVTNVCDLFQRQTDQWSKIVRCVHLCVTS